MAGERVNLDGEAVRPLRICVIGAGGFIGSHLCERLMWETAHRVLAVDVYGDKIRHLLQPGTTTTHPPWSDRIEFHKINIKHDSRLEGLIKTSDLVINLAAICTPADYNTRPLDTIYSNFVDALPVVQYCRENDKRLIHFSTCEVYGKTIGSFLPSDSPLKNDPAFYMLKEDETPCIFGSIDKQRWSYACAKQLIERLIYGEGAENGLEFTIVRPFNWIGPRMDFIPGVDGPRDSVPRVLACFSNNLMRGEPLKLVDGGKSQRTFIYIKDAIDAVQRMIENPARANGQIFNVGNPHNEVTVRELAELMTDVYCKVSGNPRPKVATIDVSSQEFYGAGYDDSDKRIPDMTIIKRQLEWEPSTSLYDLMEQTLTYQHTTYAQAVKTAMSKAIVNN
uniref:UDP-apiose/UDP-xylose synthase n=1 Tax=Hedwigia ciliata TaxID=52988 RepID=A0A1B3TP31_HEDCI|nr:UDP-apiose/UDP-xylose synthase [Hedwigia ciliata]